MALAVLVLEALAHQRRAAGRGTHEEATGPGIGRGPDQVTHTLESEHRVEGEERHHRNPAVGMRGGSCGPRGETAGFGDALLEDLAVGGLLVAEQQLVVDGLVQLALGGIDAELAEQGVHAEGTGLVGDDRHYACSDGVITAEVAQQPGERGRGARRLVPRSAEEFVEGVRGRRGDGPPCRHPPLGQRSVECAAPFQQVAGLG